MEAVAAAAGVAVSTVSRALRGDPRISPRTREHVSRIAVDLGYRPNPLVSALMAQLRTNRPAAARFNLAWLDFFQTATEWKSDPVQAAFFSGASRRAKAMGYSLERVMAYANRPERLRNLLHNRGIRGVLLPNLDEGSGLAARLPLPLEEFALVSVGTRYEGPKLHYVSDDQYESGRLAVQRLWELGYRRIGYFGVPRLERIVNGRFFAGYHTTLHSELGRKPLPPLVSTRDADIPAWLKRHRFDAIITANRHFVSVLKDLGVRIPEQVAVAHLNVDVFGRDASGEIAGIRQDNVGVGENAVDLLLSLLHHNEIGVPVHPRGTEVHGTWVDGASATRRQT